MSVNRKIRSEFATEEFGAILNIPPNRAGSLIKTVTQTWFRSCKLLRMTQIDNKSVMSQRFASP